MEEKRSKLLIIAAFVVLIGWIVYVTAGFAVRNPDVIVYQTPDSLYIKQYTLYNKDSLVCSFKQSQQYIGVITNKRKDTLVTVLPGREGYYKTIYHTIITHDSEKMEIQSKSMYDEYDVGDVVTIEVSWYPRYTVRILERSVFAIDSEIQKDSNKDSILI